VQRRFGFTVGKRVCLFGMFYSYTTIVWRVLSLRWIHEMLSRMRFSRGLLSHATSTQKIPTVIRLAITGGPCGGKTTALAKLQEVQSQFIIQMCECAPLFWFRHCRLVALKLSFAPSTPRSSSRSSPRDNLSTMRSNCTRCWAERVPISCPGIGSQQAGLGGTPSLEHSQPCT
jgi:hypothetical protein